MSQQPLFLQFDPFPVIVTERLVLREVRPDDREEVFAIRSNPDTMQFIPRPLAKTVEDVDAVIAMINGFTAKNERINWAVTEKGSDRLLGIFGYVNVKQESFRAEVGYVMHEDGRGKGYAEETLKAILDYGFDVMNLHSVEAIIRPDNPASIRLVERFGFIREGYFKDYIWHNDRFWDETIYSLIR